MDSDLDKLDEIRKRLPVSFEEAQSALSKTGGDVVSALVLLEQEGSSGPAPAERARQLVAKVRGWVERGKSTRLLVRNSDEVVVQMPVAAGLISAVVSPRLALIGAVATLVGGYRLELQETSPSAGDEVMMPETQFTH